MIIRKLKMYLLVGTLFVGMSTAKAFAAEETGVVEDTIVAEELVVESDIETDVEEVDEAEVEEIAEEVEEIDAVETESEESEETVEKEETVVEKETTVKEKAVEKYTKSELRLLTALIYCEAQGESYQGKLAVGIVVVNRKNSKLFPNSIKEVIYQKYQFGPARNGTLEKALSEYDKGNFTSKAELECIKAAKKALQGTTDITVNDKKVDFSKYLYFSGRVSGYTIKVGNHQFK